MIRYAGKRRERRWWKMKYELIEEPVDAWKLIEKLYIDTKLGYNGNIGDYLVRLNSGEIIIMAKGEFERQYRQVKKVKEPTLDIQPYTTPPIPWQRLK
ncbi:MAG: hypothetical protein AABY07_00970 [Nanoarchaeota archaeon]